MFHCYAFRKILEIILCFISLNRDVYKVISQFAKFLQFLDFNFLNKVWVTALDLGVIVLNIVCK